MHNGIRRGLVGLVLAVAASMAPAQGTILVDPGPLMGGSSITITYTNPGMAGKTIDVEVTGITLPEPVTITIPVQLDASGKGQVQWTVPGWWFAVTFNAQCADEETREISPGPKHSLPQ